MARMECVACLRSPATESAVVLRRINRKGETGVWMCDDCLAESPILLAERQAYAKALRLAQLDREGDWATLADSLNSALREAQLSEVKPEVEAIKAGANSLLYALNRERQALTAASERPACIDCGSGHGGYVPCVRHGGAEHGFGPEAGAFFIVWDDTWEHQRRRAEHAEAMLAAASERERRLEALVRDMLEAEAEAAPRDWNQRECPCDWCAQASAALDGREG